MRAAALPVAITQDSLRQQQVMRLFMLGPSHTVEQVPTGTPHRLQPELCAVPILAMSTSVFLNSNTGPMAAFPLKQSSPLTADQSSQLDTQRPPSFAREVLQGCRILLLSAWGLLKSPGSGVSFARRQLASISRFLAEASELRRGLRYCDVTCSLKFSKDSKNEMR